MDDRIGRREFLKRAGLGATALGLGGSAVVSSILTACSSSSGGGSSGSGPIKVGVLVDLTGPLGPFGKSQLNMTWLAMEDLNNAGGVLGRKIELVTEDAASDNTTAVSKAKKLVDQQDIVLVMGVLTSAMRDAVKGTIIDRGNRLYIYPTLYEGGDCHKNLFCTGPVPAQQVVPLVNYAAEKNVKNFYLVGADYVWPHKTNDAVKAEVAKVGGKIVGEEYFPLDATDFSTVVQKIMGSDANAVYCTVIPAGIWTFVRQIHEAGFKKKGTLIIPYLDEASLSSASADVLEDIVSCLEYYTVLDRPSDKALAERYKKSFNDGTYINSNATGMYRGLHLWANAVQSANSLDIDKVRKALDSAKWADAPGGPTAFVPGQHHVSLNMYLAVFKGGNVQILKNLGDLPPNEGCKL